MNTENTGLIAWQNVDGPPTTVVHKARTTSSEVPNLYKTGSEFGDPPGVPVSPVTGSLLRSSDRKSTMDGEPRSVQLVDEKEHLLFDDCESFADELGCPMNHPVKVVAIVGNTGDGKSYTMNQAFFRGQNVFTTSTSQTTCTMGVWAAYVPSKSCILLDTEGMLGTTLNQNQHRRLLLKVFAVADIVIYLTKAPRLHTDMFTFLADASDSFSRHFRPDLADLAKRTRLPWTPRQLGPAVIVFQETRHTDPLDISPKSTAGLMDSNSTGFSDSTNNTAQWNACKILETRLAGLERNVDSFSSLDYIGIQTKDGTTDYKAGGDLIKPLRTITAKLLKDNEVRAPRKLEHIFCTLHLLNKRFACDIPSNGQYTFVEEYFTCPVKCDSCSVRCCLGVGHSLSQQPHQASPPVESQAGGKQETTVSCRYDSVLKNKLYYCKECYASGVKNIVVPKAGDSVFYAARYFLSGFVLECKRHGIIYESRRLWSGNAEPEDTARVHWEVVHVWSGEKTVLQGVHPFSQTLMDGFNTVTRQVSDLAGPPVRLLGDLLADSLAPEHWQPNSSIRVCAICKYTFPDPSADGVDCMHTSDRSITQVQPGGEQQISQQQQKQQPTNKSATSPSKTTKPGRQMRGSTLLPRTSTLSSTDEISGSSPKQSTMPPTLRPTSADVVKHHCRACGRGVCGICSTASLPVPGFGSNPVRVCDECYVKRRGRVIASPPPEEAAKTGDMNANNVYTGRKALELYTATMGSVPPVFSMLKDTIKDMARPEYWTPDHLCKNCVVCNQTFGPSRRIHHCRSCGLGVCDPCSPHRLPVPLRGLDLPHRVCNECSQLSTT